MFRRPLRRRLFRQEYKGRTLQEITDLLRDEIHSLAEDTRELEFELDSEGLKEYAMKAREIADRLATLEEDVIGG